MGVVNYTPATEADGVVINAAAWATEVTNPWTAIQSAWTAWTPTVTGITLGTGGATVAEYNRVGKTIDFFIQTTFGTSGAVTGSITYTLPVTALRSQWAAADCNGYHNATPATFPLEGLATSTTILTIRAFAAAANAAFVATGANVPFTWAANDILTVIGRYQAA